MTALKHPRILLVQAWISDFAAFDQWSRPVGLLFLAALLRQAGCELHFLDCLDRHDVRTREDPAVYKGDAQRHGTGKWPKLPLPTPGPLADLPRRYYRYGISETSLEERLAATPRPELILCSSGMTYWYPGLFDTLDALRRAWPQVPIWLGGTYARLCPDHARQHSGVQRVFDRDIAELPALLEAELGCCLDHAGDFADLAAWPRPAWDLLDRLDYASLLSSRGCPMACPYCASGQLFSGFQRRRGQDLAQEILDLHQQRGVQDFAFHDDALLLEPAEEFRLALECLSTADRGLRFHCPNALHVNAVDREWARLMKKAGFETIRLGLESGRQDADLYGGKTDLDRFAGAVEALRGAGFQASQIGAYLLAGLPGQGVEEVSVSIEAVAAAGALPFLAEYSPLPGTALFHRAQACSGYDLEEPLFHNNSFFACRRPDFTLEDLDSLKNLARRRRALVRRGEEM